MIVRAGATAQFTVKEHPVYLTRSVSLALLMVVAGSTGLACQSDSVPPLLLVNLTQSDESVMERTGSVTLTAEWDGVPTSHSWRQVSGPHVEIVDGGINGATLVMDKVEVAARSNAVFELTGVGATDNDVVTAQVSVAVLPVDRVPAFGTDVHIGGGSAVVTGFDHGAGRWMAFGVGNRLTLSAVAAAAQPKVDLHLPGYIIDILVTSHEGHQYALVAMGAEGIAIVDLADPGAPRLLDAVGVNYYQDGVTFAEGGGDIIPDQVISSTSGTITTLATDGTTLWIGDADYGIHRTALTNLLGADGVVREADGTLQIDSERYTLQYAGENPWGGPLDLQLRDGHLFAALGFLGLGIFDPTTLEPIGSYNLYTDPSAVEDWFIDLDPREAVQRDPVTDEPFVDANTGMPDYRQANFEISQVWHGGTAAPTPWAEFDRYGRYYYMARSVDVASYQGRDVAYVAYALGGLVAVDITGLREGDGATSLLGIIPAVPAHGPDEPRTGETKSLYPHYGWGMLKEAGIKDVKVRDGVVWYADHFAGLVAVSGADDPGAHWHGAKGQGGYNNDDPSLGEGVLGDHWPDDEFVTSFDMSPHDPMDNESLPQWLYESPAVLATGEIIGHGGPFELGPTMDLGASGGADVLQATGAGGVAWVDIVDLTASAQKDRYGLLAWYPTTDELGAAADGSVTQPMSIGHTQGITASDQYLYVGDGPHGVSAWQIAEATGAPIDTPRLVGNTVQSEYPVSVGGDTVYPATHASMVVYDEASQSLLSCSQSVGLRRVPVGPVEEGLGSPGAPLLLRPQLTDIFEHGGGGDGGDGDLKGQDHANGVVLDGDLAFVADGTMGITVYDLSKDPTDISSGYIVGNLGGEKQDKPPLGRSTAVDLWRDPTSDRQYLFVAGGARGVGVIDATDPKAMSFVKVFEPIKLEDDTINGADGRAVDVRVIGDMVWFTYSSFGLVGYTLTDLLAPLPEGVDPTEIWSRAGKADNFDHRPVAVGYLDLTSVPGYEHVDYEFLFFDHTDVLGEVVLYIGAGDAGLAVVDVTDPSTPTVVELVPTVGNATAAVVRNGRLYVADDAGGVVAFR
jgi:hypothetical protein